MQGWRPHLLRLTCSGILCLRAAQAQPAASAVTPGRIVGSVFTADGAPLGEADVLLLGTPHRARTDARGDFELRAVAPGPYLVQVRRLGYVPEVRALGVRDTLTQLAYTLGPLVSPGAQALDTVRTQARAPVPRPAGGAAGLAARRGSLAVPASSYLDYRDLERLQPLRLSEALARMPGVRMVGAVPQSRRGAASLAVSCGRMVVVLDGVRWPLGPGGVDVIPWTNVAAVEVYRGGATVPAEYNVPDAACGVLLLWTRTGAERSGGSSRER